MFPYFSFARTGVLWSAQKLGSTEERSVILPRGASWVVLCPPVDVLADAPEAGHLVLVEGPVRQTFTSGWDSTKR